MDHSFAATEALSVVLNHRITDEQARLREENERLRQLLDGGFSDQFLAAVVNLVHEHRSYGYGGVDVLESSFTDGEGDPRFHVERRGWMYGEEGLITLEHMLSTIPKLCAMGLHVVVYEPGCVNCPFSIYWETPDDLDETRLARLTPG